MKCVKMVDGEIRRVMDAEAAEMVGGSAAEYIRKKVWKQVRDIGKTKAEKVAETTKAPAKTVKSEPSEKAPVKKQKIKSKERKVSHKKEHKR